MCSCLGCVRRQYQADSEQKAAIGRIGDSINFASLWDNIPQSVRFRVLRIKLRTWSSPTIFHSFRFAPGKFPRILAATHACAAPSGIFPNVGVTIRRCLLCVNGATSPERAAEPGSRLLQFSNTV